jgi:hypothetical protein
MLNKNIGKIATAMGITLLSNLNASAHPGGHEGISNTPHATNSELLVALQDADASASPKTTGQGDLKFKVLHTSKALPSKAMKGLNAAHGGFAVDRRKGKGEVYFALPQVGIIRISKDLNTIDLLATDDSMSSTNMHNTTIWYGKKDKAYLTFPGNDSNKVYTTTITGDLLNTLDGPTVDTKFDDNRVTKYFAEDKKFVPTDVEFLDKKFYITTGYSALDYVLTADVKTRYGVKTEWTPFAFGGKGRKEGQFGTGHGITIAPDGKTLTVADRPNSEIESFDKKGNYIGKLDLPKGSLPCDIDYESGYTVVGCLDGPDKTKGAPIYIVKDEKVVSTLVIQDDLGLPKFKHIHNAVMVKRNGKFYVIAQAWNPGDFVILEQVN